MSNAQAIVFDIQRFCVHDGPGIRTVVFFKGCGLDCRWCQNPEGRRATPELSYHEDRCLAECQACVRACPEQAVRPDMHARVDWSACTHCGACVEVCPTRALERVGEAMGPQQLLEAVMADAAFFRRSGGGVTLSGGEPVLHAPFLGEFLPLAKRAGLHVVLETAGQYRYADLEPLLEHIDLILFDVKAGGSERHLQLVGHDNTRILDNLRALLARGEAGPAIELRMPVAPGLNDGEASLAGVAKQLAALGQSELTLLAYNHLWEAKLPRLDTPRVALGIGAQTPEYYDRLRERFAAHGIQARLAV